MTKGHRSDHWNDAEILTLTCMAEAGDAYPDIAERLGRSIKSVKAKIARMGMTRTKKQKGWPAEEVAQLIHLRDNVHLNFNEIGRRLGRPGSTCYQRYYDFHRAPPPHRVVPQEPMSKGARQDWVHRMSLSPPTLTAAFFGDPLPGYSALDKRASETAA